MILPTPPPNGTTHRPPPLAAFQFAVRVGCQVMYRSFFQVVVDEVLKNSIWFTSGRRDCPANDHTLFTSALTVHFPGCASHNNRRTYAPLPLCQHRIGGRRHESANPSHKFRTLISSPHTEYRDLVCTKTHGPMQDKDCSRVGSIVTWESWTTPTD
jgi:hypothetical protein